MRGIQPVKTARLAGDPVDARPALRVAPGVPRAATLVGVAASATLLVLLYRSMDVRQIWRALLGADPYWVVVSIGLILPITVLRALRFYVVAPPGAVAGPGDALRLTLVASALNVVLPAKTGDLIKSYFVAQRSATPAGVAVSIVVYERLCDVFALIVWCLAGWLVGRPQVPGLPSWFWWLLAALGAACGLLISSERAAALWHRVAVRTLPWRKLRRVRDMAAGWPQLLQALRGRRRRIVGFSLFLWLAHLFQIWLFTVALSVDVTFTVCASLSAVALMAGQLPLTFAGIGTRDLALVVLLSRYAAPESAAAMGILIATRGLVPPLVGMPLMWPFLSSVVDDARRWLRAVGPTG